ncbi:hypothetical protein ACOME3_005264 [Neoechinorhynchus agilis]
MSTKDRYVSFKSYTTSADQRNAFVSRYNILSGIEHRGLCQYLDVIQSGESFCVVTEDSPMAMKMVFENEELLRKCISSEEEGIEFFKQILSALRELKRKDLLDFLKKEEQLVDRLILTKDGPKIRAYGHNYLKQSRELQFKSTEEIFKDLISLIMLAMEAISDVLDSQKFQDFLSEIKSGVYTESWHSMDEYIGFDQFIDPFYRRNAIDNIETAFSERCIDEYEVWKLGVSFVSMSSKLNDSTCQIFTIDRQSGAILFSSMDLLKLQSEDTVSSEWIRQFKRSLLCAHGNQTPISFLKNMPQFSAGFITKIRSTVWHLLLDIGTNDLNLVIEDESHRCSDLKQIRLDIGRCHQYDPLLSSPEGQLQLLTVLRTWLFLNPDLRYWQGLDSLTAMFVKMNYGNDAVAASCLHRLTSLLFKGFLCSIMTPKSIRNRLMLFLQLLTFFEPKLANRFRRLNFGPELFAIPWLLTVFISLFGLNRSLTIWDNILQSENGVLMITLTCVSIILQLKEQILNDVKDVNDFLILFSHLPSTNNTIISSAKVL